MSRLIPNFPEISTSELRRRLALHESPREIDTRELRYLRLWSIQVLNAEIRRRAIEPQPNQYTERARELLYGGVS